MENNTKIHVGIDNSLSGAVAAIDANSGDVIDWIPMPVRLDADKDKEVDLGKIEQFIHNLPCDDYCNDVIITLEKPYMFSKGSKAMQTMWYCYGMIKGRFEHSDYEFYTINPTKWQNAILGTFSSGQSKAVAEAKVLELHGCVFGKTKVIRGGVHDAMLIAEYQRRAFNKSGRL